ncbi:hypothetical protein cyc_09006 [Cyclospora cayetanensis]|uniref:Uncharacterized protein n=1 Tax=Cyclospora cayetanensis TaxID=88456 RepID=A0A1D3D155_9EIME|nr:hypothetical protein cyc_09006 [Cyclospora cayetanensis]
MGAPYWSLPPDEEGPLGAPGDSESEGLGGGGGASGGPLGSPGAASLACRPQEGGAPWTPFQPRADGRSSRRVSLDSGTGTVGALGGGIVATGGPSPPPAIKPQALKDSVWDLMIPSQGQSSSKRGLVA